MARLFSLLVFLSIGYAGYAQVAPPATYVLFNNQNMDILDYRLAFSSNTTQYYAYNFKPGGNDQFLWYSGSAVNMDYLPNNTVSSRDFKLNEDIVTGVNRVTRQLFVVIQQQRGYVVAPIVSITKITNSGKYIFLNANNYSYVFDTDNINMGRELSTAGSAASVTLTSFGYKNCKYQYSFKRTPNVKGAESAEFDFIPGIGITFERSGRNAAEMQNNQVNLWGINGLALSDFIAKECGTSTAITPYTPPTATPAPGTVTPSVDPRLGDPQTAGQPNNATTTNAWISAISKYPAVNCGKTAAPGMHLVQPKETINSISKFYKVTPAQILKWNGIKDANKISICQEIRVIAPGGSLAKGLQPIVVGTLTTTPPAGGVQVTPPAPPDAAPGYTSVQPAPSGGWPDLFGSPTGTPNYIAPQPTITVPPSTPVAGSGQYYKIQAGEGVAAIARKFGYTEERFRSMNNMPATGNVPLQLGQTVKVSDCDQGTTYMAPPKGNIPSQVVPELTQPIGGSYYTPPATTNSGNYYQPVTSSTTPIATPPTNIPGYTPVGGSIQGTQPAVTTPAPTQTSIKRDPIGFKDYFVRDSETIRDIARKEKFDPSELGLINGRDPNEMLAPGTRIQLPIY